MKKETLEEFLARGGKVNIISPQIIEQPAHLMKTSNPPEGYILSLDDGAHYFAENKKKIKKKEKISLKDVIDNFNLPKDIADRLRGGHDNK